MMAGVFAPHAVVLAALAVAPSSSHSPSPTATSPAPACAATLVISSGVGTLSVSPSTATLAVGKCVTFSNNSDQTARVTVTGPGASWTVNLKHGQTGDYVAAAVGKHPASVAELLLSATATITVDKAKAGASDSPSASASRSGSRSPSSSASPSSSHSNSPTPKTHGHTKSPIPTLSIPPGLTESPYTVTSQGPGSSPIVAGRVPASVPVQVTPTDPVTSVPAQSVALTGSAGDSDRLPLVIAAVLAIGEALAIMRVLLGVPVDSARRRGRKRP